MVREGGWVGGGLLVRGGGGTTTVTVSIHQEAQGWHGTEAWVEDGEVQKEEVRVGSQHPPDTPHPYKTSPSPRRSGPLCHSSGRLPRKTARLFPPSIPRNPFSHPSLRPTCGAVGLFSVFKLVKVSLQNMQRHGEAASKDGGAATEWVTWPGPTETNVLIGLDFYLVEWCWSVMATWQEGWTILTQPQRLILTNRRFS